MDSLQDFFKEFKNRIANPFFFSFIIAWLLWNWKVTVGFLMYNQDTLKNYGYFNYSYLITENASWQNYLYHPFISAAIYTFGFPPIRVGIIAFLSWMDRINTWSKKKIMKNATVPMRRFIKETERTDNLSQKLEELYKKDSTIKLENDILKSQLNQEMNISAEQSIQIRNFTEEVLSLNNNIGDLKNRLSLSEERIQLYSKQFDQSLIEGTWTIDFIKNLSGNSHYREVIDSTIVSIKNYEIYLIAGDAKTLWARIIAFNYSYSNKSVNMTMKMNSDKDNMDINVLYFQMLTIESYATIGQIKKMTGIDSNSIDVVYTLLVN